MNYLASNLYIRKDLRILRRYRVLVHRWVISYFECLKINESVLYLFQNLCVNK